MVYNMKFYCNIVDGVFTIDKQEFNNVDVVLLGFNSINKINYKNELQGLQENLLKISKISKETKKVLVCATYTDNYSIIKKSAIVAENGKILGIADMHLKKQEDSTSISFGYKIYQTKNGKIGVLIDDDLYDFDAVKCMSMCDVEVIIILSDKSEKSNLTYLLRAYSLLFGICIIMLTPKSVIYTNSQGEIENNSETSKIINLNSKKHYTVTTTKQRGLIK